MWRAVWLPIGGPMHFAGFYVADYVMPVGGPVHFAGFYVADHVMPAGGPVHFAGFYVAGRVVACLRSRAFRWLLSGGPCDACWWSRLVY